MLGGDGGHPMAFSSLGEARLFFTEQTLKDFEVDDVTATEIRDVCS